MVLHLPWLWVVVIDAGAWAAWSALAGWLTGRPHVARRGGDGPVLRLRRWELGGRWYETNLHIRAWKHRLPEAGTAFGGRSKRHLPPGGAAKALPTFLAECRRAERTHWLILAATPAFAVWNPPGLFLAMVVFAVVANVPCLAVLRYNRARMLARQPGLA
jgi:glycosyl-4,4'-diaponeurosporenoate acyltransferase